MTTFAARHISIAIECAPDKVYAFIGDPGNLPRWASGLSGSIEQVDGEWIAESPMGKVRVTFVAPNAFGVLDHDVATSTESFHNPMRVVANGDGSEVIFTLLRRDGVGDDEFATDEASITRDLAKLKQLLES